MNPLERVGARPGVPFTVTFDGREIEVLPGRTVAAALWAAGVVAWRTTREEGRPRGVLRDRRLLRLSGDRGRPPRPARLPDAGHTGRRHPYAGRDGTR